MRPVIATVTPRWETAAGLFVFWGTHVMDRPASLFKYQSFSERSLLALRYRQIFFAHPKRFNDPFDCQLRISQQAFTLDDVAAIVTKWFVEDGKSPAEAMRLIRRDPKGAKQLAEKMLPTEFSATLRKLFDGHGVCCFGEECDNLLMWGHYADGHRGFCLEFDATADLFSKARPVEYRDDFPALDLKAVVISDNLDEAMRLAAFTKPTAWRYEREWRVIHRDADKDFGYGAETLKAIYFGAAMDSRHSDLLALVLHGSPTKKFKMELSETEYKVTPHEVQYTPAPMSGGGGNWEEFRKAQETHGAQNPEP